MNTSPARAGIHEKIRRPTVRETTFDDYAQIVSLHQQYDFSPKAHDQWVTQWSRNPVYRKAEDRWPIGWVLETEKREIVGSIENVPFVYHLRGREIRAAAACAWIVDARHRGHSLLLLDQITRQSHADFVLTTTASPNAESVFKIFQWSKVPVGTWDSSAFWITNHRSFLQIAFREKRVSFAAVLSYPAAAALFSRDTFREWVFSSNRTLEVDFCCDFDDRFDEFWDTLRQQNPDKLLCERTRETLAWHFRHLRMSETGWILTASNGSRLVAYAIFDRQDNAILNLARVRLIDFQALNGFEHLLRPTIRCMLQICRSKGIHVLENIGSWLDRPDLRLNHNSAPYRRPLPSWGFYYKVINPELAGLLRDPNIWVPSSFDGDVSL